MSFDVSDAITTGATRFVSRTGGVLVGLYAAFTLLSTAAIQGLVVLAAVRWVEPIIRTEGPPLLEEMRATNPEAAAEFEPVLNEVLQDGLEPVLREFLPYAITVNWVVAAAALGAAVFGLVATNVAAYEAFGRGMDTPDTSLLRGLAWRGANTIAAVLLLSALMLGALGIAIALQTIHPILTVLGVLVWIPFVFVVAVPTFYVPAAIAIDGVNALRGIVRSYSVARRNVLGTIALLVLWFVVVMAVGTVSSTLTGPLPPVVATPVDQVINAAVTMILIAVVATAYTADRTDDSGDDSDSSTAEDPGTGEQPE